ncbi:MAG: hypothetical protein SVP52_02155 [Chloroflexota bacterium]|nr:hypothetical protein [Chloroflexota bacterium]
MAKLLLGLLTASGIATMAYRVRVLLLLTFFNSSSLLSKLFEGNSIRCINATSGG